MTKQSLSILILSLLCLMCAVSSTQTTEVFDHSKKRQLRRIESEILDLDYYKTKIRLDYYNTTPGIENTTLRIALNNMIDFKNNIPRHNL